jgi:hypothetical protein
MTHDPRLHLPLGSAAPAIGVRATSADWRDPALLAQSRLAGPDGWLERMRPSLDAYLTALVGAAVRGHAHGATPRCAGSGLCVPLRACARSGPCQRCLRWLTEHATTPGCWRQGYAPLGDAEWRLYADAAVAEWEAGGPEREAALARRGESGLYNPAVRRSGGGCRVGSASRWCGVGRCGSPGLTHPAWPPSVRPRRTRRSSATSWSAGCLWVRWAGGSPVGSCSQPVAQRPWPAAHASRWGTGPPASAHAVCPADGPLGPQSRRYLDTLLRNRTWTFAQRRRAVRVRAALWPGS